MRRGGGEFWGGGMGGGGEEKGKLDCAKAQTAEANTVERRGDRSRAQHAQLLQRLVVSLQELEAGDRLHS